MNAHTPYNDKHQGWIVDCPECGCSSPCQMCDGSEWIAATLDDFDGDMVRLHTGATVLCEGGAFFDKDCNELASADVTDIAAVLEAVAA